MRLLFICTANISRSFLAEMLFRHEIDRCKMEDVSVASAGTNAVPGRPPDPEMVAYLIRQKIPVAQHVARLVQKADVEGADSIFVMEKRQAADIIRRWPRAEGKVRLLASYVSADAPGGDISDPYGGSVFQYRQAQAQISLAIKNIVQELGRLPGGGPGCS